MRIVPLLFTFVLLTGCNTWLTGYDIATHKGPDDRRDANQEIVTSIPQAQEKAGVLSHKMVNASYFEPGTERLNSLGQRNMTILAEFFLEQPGTLAFPREDATDALYEARCKTIFLFLINSGVPEGHVELDESAFAGGPGIDTERAIQPIEQDTSSSPRSILEL